MGADFSSIIHDEDLDDQTRVGFSESQIKVIKRKFFDKCGNGVTMNKSDFAKLLCLDEDSATPVSIPNTSNSLKSGSDQFFVKIANLLKSDKILNSKPD